MLLLLFMVCTTLAEAQLNQDQFDQYFVNQTLRIDFELGGNDSTTHVFWKGMSQQAEWAGPRKNLIDPFNYGNFRIVARDSVTNKILFVKGFSSPFQEWATTAESHQMDRAFEHSILMPYPKQSILISIDERQYATGVFQSIFKKIINPHNYFIREELPAKYKTFTIHKASSDDHSKNLDLVILAEGYKKNEMGKVKIDARKIAGYLFATSPYDQYRDRINIYAVAAPSEQSGTDIPGEHIYRNTTLDASFYTFDLDRYLCTFDYFKMNDLAASVPHDAIFVLINSDRYGGGGFYNYYTGCTASNALSNKVCIHEFGHGFAGLADEYYTSAVAYNNFYNLSTEPWEPNITTNVHFEQKWKNMIQPGIPIPTPRIEKNENVVGMFEGGGYAEKGIYSPMMDCIMASNEAHPVLSRLRKGHCRYIAVLLR